MRYFNHTSVLLFLIVSLPVFSACKKEEKCTTETENEEPCIAESSEPSDDPSGEGTTTDTDDTQAPAIGAGPNFADITTSGVSVSWTAATDNVSTADDLEYKLVSASSTNALASLDDAAAVTGDGVALDWTPATLSKQITGLNPAESLAFAVLVRDAAGNVALYPAQTVTTLEQNAPTVGTAATFSNIAFTSFSVTWGAASSAASAQNKLKYRAVMGTSAESIDTLAEALAVTGSDLLLDWTENQLATYAAGVHFARTYWIAVLVKDEGGRTSLYSPVSVNTPHHRLIFATSMIHAPTLLSVTANADAACEAAKPAGHTGTFKALYAGGTRTACTNAYCNPLVMGDLQDWPLLPTTSYESITGDLIWTTGTRPIVNAGATVGQLVNNNNHAWTGLNADWTAATANCSNWSSVSSGVNGTFGWPSNTNDAVWSGYTTICSATKGLYCVEQ